MAEYYFIGAALPPLVIGIKPELSFNDFYEMLLANMNQSDMGKVNELIWSIDLNNIRALWLGYPLDERGLYTQKELVEALLVREGFPDYLNDFLDQYESLVDRIRFFPGLYASMYQEMKKKGGFLATYYSLEREIRLVCTALRAKQSGRNIVRELQFEDPVDPFVMSIISQKDAPDYIVPVEYEELRSIFLRNLADPKKLHLELLVFRFKKVEQSELFSMDRILSYMVQLMIVESWENLDQELGNTIVEDLSKHG
jgi:hypothetical protein